MNQSPNKNTYIVPMDFKKMVIKIMGKFSTVLNWININYFINIFIINNL